MKYKEDISFLRRAEGRICGIIHRIKTEKNKLPRVPGKKEEELLYSPVKGLYIGFIPIGLDFIHRFSNFSLKFRQFLPKFLGVKRFVHACIFLETKKCGDENQNEGVLVEYGAYAKNYEDYKHEVFF